MKRMIFTAVLLSCSPATAQPAAEMMMARAREMAVAALEAGLTRHTGQNTTTIYVKKLPGLFQEARYCGIARVGSERQRFVADMGENLVVMQPSQTVWVEAGCETNPQSTTILRDLR